jgi:hypothetical protein
LKGLKVLPYNIVYGYLSNNFPSISYIKQSQSDAPTPKLPYCAFSEVSFRRIGRSHNSFGENDSQEYIERVQVLNEQTLQLIFCSKTEQQAVNEGLTDYKPAYQLASEFLTSTFSSNSKSYEKSNGFSLIDYRDLSSSSLYLSDVHELRSPIELVFNFFSCLDFAFDQIQEINVNQTILGIDGETQAGEIQTFNINTPDGENVENISFSISD